MRAPGRARLLRGSPLPSCGGQFLGVNPPCPPFGKEGWGDPATGLDDLRGRHYNGPVPLGRYTEERPHGTNAKQGQIGR